MSSELFSKAVPVVRNKTIIIAYVIIHVIPNLFQCKCHIHLHDNMIFFHLIR